MDALTDLLGRARATGALFAETVLRGRGGLELPAGSPLTLHVVSGDGLWLRGDGPDRPLADGDVLLVREGVPLAVLGGPAEQPAPLDRLLAVPGARRPGASSTGAATGHLDLPGEGPPARLLCGAYALSGSVCDRLLTALPPVVQVAAAGTVRTVVDLLVQEVRGAAPGQQTALDRLLDLLLVHVLRAHFAEQASPRWYDAAADPVIGPALRALHADPARPWTVDALARVAGLSRAAFARRFTAVVGDPPLTYLTGWRMALAQDALLREGSTLAAVAREVGYGSEFALSAAFTRHVGVAPSRWRERARAAG